MNNTCTQLQIISISVVQHVWFSLCKHTKTEIRKKKKKKWIYAWWPICLEKTHKSDQFIIPAHSRAALSLRRQDWRCVQQYKAVMRVAFCTPQPIRDGSKLWTAVFTGLIVASSFPVASTITSKLNLYNAHVLAWRMQLSDLDIEPPNPITYYIRK